MAGQLMESQEPEIVYLENLGTNSERSKKERFDEFLSQAIDEALSSLGEPVKNSLYQRLEVDFNIQKNEIPEKIEVFSNIIHKIFGLGACRLERKFLKNLNTKVQSSAELPECECSLSNWIVMEVSFEEYVTKIRKNYESL
jgi:hypothetical protein